MNVASGKVRVVFDSRQVGLSDLAAVVCATGYGLRVSQTMVRAPGAGGMVRALRRAEGVVDAAWDQSREFVIVSYLPCIAQGRALLAAIRAAGYSIVDDALTAPVMSTIRVLAKEAVALGT